MKPGLLEKQIKRLQTLKIKFKKITAGYMLLTAQMK